MNNPVPESMPTTIANLDVLFSYLMWGCTVLGLLAMIGGGAKFSRSRMSGDDDKTGLQICGGGLLLAVAATVGRSVFPPVSVEGATDLPPADPPAVPDAPVADAPALPASDVAPEDPMDWTPVLWLGATMLAVALAAYLIVRTRSHVVDRRNAKKALEADYAAAHAVYSEVADAYAAYLADPYSIFVRPLLDDLTEPRTAAFIDAFVEMNYLRPDQCPDTLERVQAFAAAAHKARSTWRSADGYARTMGLRVTSVEGQRTGRRIRSALGIALDDAATGQERETALCTVQELAADLVTIPDRIYDNVKKAIGTTTRKQLTS
ncbi:hypothetical protein [Rhodococcoides fascians]|uniref:hypothetical protein n=1 Tax=Rhodococcoides fascians TaxID=1828 RepID=UPI00050C4D19|nr:hypothetical protein [Rhodococcus fascians]